MLFIIQDAIIEAEAEASIDEPQKVESEIFWEELMPESVGDMSEESYELLLESIISMDHNKLVSYINQLSYELS